MHSYRKEHGNTHTHTHTHTLIPHIGKDYLYSFFHAILSTIYVRTQLPSIHILIHARTHIHTVTSLTK